MLSNNGIWSLAFRKMLGLYARCVKYIFRDPER